MKNIKINILTYQPIFYKNYKLLILFILENGSSEQSIDNNNAGTSTTADKSETILMAINQDNVTNVEHSSTLESTEQSSTKITINVDTNDEKTTISSEDGLIEYSPHNEGENKNEEGDSIQINIHLIEKTENNHCATVQTSIQLITVLSSMVIKLE